MIKKQIFTLLISLGFFAFCGTLLAQQSNFLDPQRYSFEDGGSSTYYQQTGTFWSVSSDRSAGTGTYSLKFSSDAPLTETQKAKNGGIDIPAGNYIFKLKIWKTTGSQIKGFSFNIKTPWTPIPVNVDSIETDKWVEISILVTFEQDLINTSVVIPIGAADIGNGTMYIDDIGFWGEKEAEKVTLPFASSIETLEGSYLNMPAGEYDIKLKLWKGTETIISKFTTSVSKPWMNLEWEIDTVSAMGWTELSQSCIFSDSVEDATFKIEVKNQGSLGGGSGEIYIDDIEFVRKGDYTSISTLDISHSELELRVEEAFNLDYTLLPSDASQNGVVWISADSSIANVNSLGEVEAKSVGKTNISVFSKDGYFVQRCLVTVIKRDTKIENQLVETIKLKPNPFTSHLRIEMGRNSFRELHLYSLSGKKVLSQTLYGQTSVSLSPTQEKMPAGVYFIQLIGTQKTLSLKIIRK